MRGTRTSLSAFIDASMESVLEEFEEFARSHTEVGAEMSIAALRDHAASMLTAIARDLEQPQSTAEQRTKSWGDAPVVAGADPTAAERHGRDRASSGFTLAEMFAEYRALRASVLRLWTAARGRLDGSDLQDLIRFNEAIDQALAESIQRYSASIDESRETFSRYSATTCARRSARCSRPRRSWRSRAGPTRPGTARCWRESGSAAAG